MSPEQRSCPAYPLFPSPAFALLRALIQCLWVAEVYALIYAHKPAAIRWHTICSGLVLVSGGANQPSMGQANWNRVWECSRLNICMCGYDSGYGWGWGCCGGCQEQAAPAEGHLHLTLASKLRGMRWLLCLSHMHSRNYRKARTTILPQRILSTLRFLCRHLHSSSRSHSSVLTSCHVSLAAFVLAWEI